MPDPSPAPAPALPPARDEGRYAVGLVCLGNICRSPTAHVVLEERLGEAGLLAPDGPVSVESSGTGGWHVGNPMDRRAAATLSAAGYDASRHRARQWDAAHAATLDLVLAMDAANLADLADLGAAGERTVLLRDFDPVERGADVPDPYYGGADGFTDVLEMVERSADVVVSALVEQRPWSHA